MLIIEFEKPFEFFQCPRCGQVYWPGSHRDRILEKMRAAGLVTDII